MIRSIWIQIWITAAVAMVMLALYAGVVQQLFPLVDTQKPRFEALLSQQIGQPVEIEHLSGQLNIFSPALSFEGVKAGFDDSPIFINKVVAELDVSASLYHQSLVFKRVLIDGVDMSLWQNQEGGWHWGNKNLTRRNPLDPPKDPKTAKKYPWLSWLERQKSLVLSNWTIRNRTQGVEETLKVRRVEIRNQGDQHAIEGDIAWGHDSLANVYLSAHVWGPVWPLSNQNADIYLLVEQQDWTRWLPKFLLPENLQLNKLEAGVETWLTMSGGDLDSLYLRSVIPEFSLTTPKETLNLTEGRLSVYGEKNQEDWHLTISPSFNEPLPVEDVRFSSVVLETGRGWQLAIPEANIHNVRDFLLEYSLLPAMYDRYLRNLSPSGIAKDFRLSMMKHSEGGFDIRTQVQDMSLNAYKGIPAVVGADGSFHFNAKKGVAILDQDDLQLHLPDLYDQAWNMKNTSTTAYWHTSPDLFRFSMQGFQAEIDGTTLQGDLALRLPLFHSGHDPYIGLRLGIAAGQGTQQGLFVPDVLDPAITEWLDAGIVSGGISQVGFVLNGNMGKELADTARTSQLYFESDNLDLRYLEGWPQISDIKGRLLLNSPSVDAWIDRADTLGGEISNSKVEIRHIAEQTVLSLQGNVEGDTSGALGYLQATPLADSIGHALSDWKATGQANTRLELTVDLSAEAATPSAKISTDLVNTDIHLQNTDLHFSNIHTQLLFDTAQGLFADKITATTFGGPVDIQLSSQPVGDSYDMTATATGSAKWQEINDWLDLFLTAPLSGSLDYSADLVIQAAADAPLHILLESDLVGTDIDLPFPIGKTAQDVRSLAMHIHPTAGEETELRINYDDSLRTALSIHPEQMPKGEVVFGNQEAQLGEHVGIQISGHIRDTLNAENWWDTWESMMLLAEKVEAEERLAGVYVPYRPNSAGNTNPVTSVDLTIDQMDVWDMPSGVTKVAGTQQLNEWTLYVQNDLTLGKIVIPEAIDAPIDMALDYVRIPIVEEEAISSISIEGADAQTELDPLLDVVPGEFSLFDVRIQEFYYETHNLGSWELQSRPIDNGLALTVLDSNTQDVHVKGVMNWHYIDGVHRTSLADVNITAKNVANIQKAFRRHALMQGKNLQSTVNLDWQGSPFFFNTHTLNGDVSAKLKDGSINLEGASAMKAVGAFNVTSVFRRLRLDFSDVLDEGISYDTVSGTAKIQEGLFEFVDPLTFEGPGGKTLTAGRADLNTGELDMKLAVTFPVTSTLPVVAVLAGFAPQIAAGIYVTERLVGDELERFTSASYNVTGSIAEPKLELNRAFDNKVEGKKERSLGQRILSIFGLGKDDD